MNSQIEKISLRPDNFEKFIGQNKIVNTIEIIIDNVKNRKEDAIFEYSLKFDKCVITKDSFKVTREEIEAAYKNLGKEKVFEMLINAEINGGPVYEKLGEEFPRLKEIAKDEIKHGNLLKGLIGKSNLN